MSVGIVNSLSGSVLKIAGGIFYVDSPVGSIFSFGGESTDIPSGFLECDGSEVTKASYSELYEVIGDNYGTPSSADKFVLPNLTGDTLIMIKAKNNGQPVKLSINTLDWEAIERLI